MKKLLFFPFFFFLTFVSHGQRVFFAPGIGIMNPYSTYDPMVGKVSTFRPNYFDIMPNCLLLIKTQITKKWWISGGYMAGDVGWGYKLTIPEKLMFNDKPSPEYRSSGSAYMHRFPFMASYRFKEIRIFPYQEEGEKIPDKFFLAFDLDFSLGIIYNRMGNNNYLGDLNFQLGLPGGNSIKIEEEESYTVNKNGLSLLGGLGMQFYIKQKPRFHLLFFYSHGLVNMVDTKITYNLNGRIFNSLLHAKGTVAGVTLSYLFKIKEF